MRSQTADPSTRAGLYQAAVDMCAWAEPRDCLAAILSQHHGAEDGYLPSPVPLAAAIAARTTTLPIMVAALLVVLYEPVKLAEDLSVVDLISRGRVSYVVGIGYRDEEFAAFGVDRGHRGAATEERIGILRRLWAGEPVDVGGRTAWVTPLPFTPGGPMLAYGGGSEVAARRAGRLGMLFVAERSDPALEDAYRQAADDAAIPPVGCILPDPDVPLTVFVADDPERAWAEIGEYLLVDAKGYAAWNAHRSGTASVSFAGSVAALEAERGAYRILTPEEAGAAVGRGGTLALQPLVGGLPPDLAWPYLEAAVAVASRPGASETVVADRGQAGPG
jgi:alkanesulfonate monooxygenase SsuD/methylene tetrahydromethanopterin reductase-like flavin-dependent oxidoreductase (luciferase family)